MFLINKKLYSHAVRDLGYTGECVCTRVRIRARICLIKLRR